MAKAADSRTTKFKRPPLEAGNRCGRLTAIEYCYTAHDGVAWWRFQCDCGTECVRNARMVGRGNTQSCGCLRREMAAALARSMSTHGKWRTLEFGIWSKIIARCENPRDKKFYLYGGRGIKICERWRKCFLDFFDDMGPRPSPKHSVDRWPDRDGNYEPNNCRWATVSQQNRNRRNNLIVQFQGRKMTLTEACQIAGVNYQTTRSRLRRGWDVERSLR